ncbi:hypothetical protein [uncultured Clostridium sp.]|jgi:hypothetical protein|uniref:hypothetical protein n=1 Tax=uncultured Clostridium sp. TaxID=59620 RepID=UPI002609CF1E|nr:hypothetical protein [uncultured Clostridium sp.]
MAIKKLCSRTGCHRVLDGDTRYCIKHKDSDKERYREYQRKRLEDKYQKKYQEFYNSSEWRIARRSLIAAVCGMDIYEYYTTGKVVAGERAHHIIELTESWTSRLDVANLIYLTEKNHRLIHAAYNRNSKKRKLTQFNLLEMRDKFYEEFGMAGGI